MKKKYKIVISCIFLLLLTGCTRKGDVLLDKDALTEVEVTVGQNQTEMVRQEPEDIPAKEQEQASSAPEADLKPEEPEFIYVHICGEVNQPGVYRLKRGSRIYQAVETAGGFRPSANEGYVNQSTELEDGMKIWIPSILEKPETNENMAGNENAGIESVKEQAISAKGQQVNLNTASLEELCTLPGIGESRAQLILAYREKEGSFKKIEDIMKIEGIKEGSFAKLKDRITVR